jgi:hypothetical protein
MAKAVFCIATNLLQAESIVQQLAHAGSQRMTFPCSTRTRAEHMSLRTNTARRRRRERLRVPERGAYSGVRWDGSLVQAHSRFRALDRFIAAGPILAALSGAAIVGAMGGLTGALLGMGQPEFEATRYAGKLVAGNFLISVHTEDSDERSRAKEIFRRAGADHVSSGSESSAEGK